MISRSILVADDLQDNEEITGNRSALIQRLASDFSVLTNSSTDLVYVYPFKDYIGNRMYTHDRSTLVNANFDKYRSVMHNFRRPGKLFIKLGSPINEIVKLVEDNRSEVLIMGSRARQGLDRFFLGSVAEEVVRAIKRPVIVLGPAAQKEDFHLAQHKQLTFLVATDLTKKCRAMETYAVSLAQRTGARILFYYSLVDTIQTAQSFAYGSGELLPAFNTFVEDIKKDVYSSMEKKVQRLKNKGIDCSFHIENEKTPMTDDLLKLKKTNDYHMIFMGNRSHGGLVGSILGSNLRDAIAKAVVPVVVVR